MNGELAIGQLRISQRTLQPNEPCDVAYDLRVVGISWERRASTALDVHKGSAVKTWGMRFHSEDPETLAKKDAHEALLKNLHKESRIISLESSISFSANVASIEKELNDLVMEIGRPLRVIIDITCLPKSYSLFFIGLGFTKGIFAKLDCLYSEGEYSNKDYQDDIQSDGSVSKRIVSEGLWSSLQVPYLESSVVIPKSHDLVVTMGGELGFSLPFVERYEPRKVGLVLIKDGLLQDPLHLTGTERDGLKQLLDEPNVETETFGLTDAVAVASYAANRARQSASECVTAIAIGAKPHALALAVAALSSPSMEVICRVPKRYKPLDVKPTGNVVLFEIEDRFEPEAYF